MTTPTEPARTISIPITAAWHTGIGTLIALTAIMGFWMHLQLPVGHTYRGSALAIGIVGSGFALTYWAVCTVQCGRTDTAAVAEAIQAVEERQRVILAAIQGIDDQNAATGTAIEELNKAITENTGAIEALQDAFLKEAKQKKRGDLALTS